MEETNGSFLTNFSFLINSNSVAVAHYLDVNNESDNDRVPDWYEVRHLGSLENNQTSDLDGDGFPCFRSIVLTLVQPSQINPELVGFPAGVPRLLLSTSVGRGSLLIQ